MTIAWAAYLVATPPSLRGWDRTVALPEITLNVHYLVRSVNETRDWHLSSDRLTLPAGYSAHADWFDGWNPDIRNAWVANCNQNARDCHAHLVGDGRELY